MTRWIKFNGNGRAILPVLMVIFWGSALVTPARGQFFDPNNALILKTLQEISARHYLTLEEQRRQTAQMTQQLRQFYDNYTLLRSDVEFSQSLYRDFKAIENLDLLSSYSTSNFILNADRPDYWLPSMTGEMSRAAMDAEAVLNNSAELQRTYESFALSVNDEQEPKDVQQRRQNAMAGEQAYSQALFEYALKCQVLSKSYDSMAVALTNQVQNEQNKYTAAERTQLLLESVKLRDLSNQYYGKYLELSQKAHGNELNMFDEKLGQIRSKESWKELQRQANKTSRVRYGFFDIIAAPTP